MEGILGHGRTPLVDELHEGDVLLCRNETDLVEVGVPVVVANELWYLLRKN